MSFQNHMVLNLDSEGGVHILLSETNHRVFWLTQMKIKRHRKEGEGVWKNSEAFSALERGEEDELIIFSKALWINQIYTEIFDS